MKKLLAGLVAMVGLLAASSVQADVIPAEMPAGIGNLYLGESIKSAKRKCEQFRLTPNQKRHATCLINEREYRLIFNAKQKIQYIGWEISPETYAACSKEILAQVGLEARMEADDGSEMWKLSYAGANGRIIGTVGCMQGDTGLVMAVMQQ